MFADCDYAEPAWYCVRPKGHDGPHQSAYLGQPEPVPPADAPSVPTAHELRAQDMNKAIDDARAALHGVSALSYVAGYEAGKAVAAAQQDIDHRPTALIVGPEKIDSPMVTFMDRNGKPFLELSGDEYLTLGQVVEQAYEKGKAETVDQWLASPVAEQALSVALWGMHFADASATVLSKKILAALRERRLTGS